MTSLLLTLRAGAAMALLAVSGATHAAVTVYTDASRFAADTVAPGIDTFGTIPMDRITSPSARAAGPYRYVASARGGLHGAGSPADPWLSTFQAGATMTLSEFSPDTRAVGGFFFGSHVGGSFREGETMTLTLTDALGTTAIHTMVAAERTSFVGFVSTDALSSLTVAIGEPFAFTSVDNLTLAAAIPEPQTFAMLLAGLGALGAMARHRRRASRRHA